ncbi:hypothetical protein C2E23DRAFT_774561, partial [Lenzites betulinus]
CQICNRAFTTSGHLSRHTRIHTGERNHKCPYPGCETRCSRQDNLQQQSVSPSLFSPSGISPLPPLIFPRRVCARCDPACAQTRPSPVRRARSKLTLSTATASTSLRAPAGTPAPPLALP